MGDSGSPVARAVGIGAVAVGVHDTHEGYFAKMQNAMNAAGVAIN
jgi:hypothetical protein